MFDPKVYRNACRELNASEEKIKEIIAMTENKDRKNSRRTMRTILVACAAITMMVVGVGQPTQRPPRRYSDRSCPSSRWTNTDRT